MSYGDDHDELISPVSTACVVLEVLARSMNPRVAVSSPKPASTVAVLRETSSRNAVWITDLLNRVNVYRPEDGNTSIGLDASIGKPNYPLGHCGHGRVMGSNHQRNAHFLAKVA